MRLNALLQNIPLKRLGQPGDVASVASFLASDEASYITGTILWMEAPAPELSRATALSFEATLQLSVVIQVTFLRERRTFACD